MPTYTVHEPPPRKGEAVSAPERFVFVRDGFYVWAFLLAPLWLLWRRLWLAFVIYVLVNIALGLSLALIGAPTGVRFLASLLIALLVGLEASTIWRRKLAWKKWQTLGFVVGDDAESVERRFYAAWTKRSDEKPAAAPAPQYSAPVRRGPPSPSDVIGLFPEPGA
ncbi:MAG TPA: DUF2628 domain-containing protein [Pseudolabrys sp.]|jgi:hypothetical protein